MYKYYLTSSNIRIILAIVQQIKEKMKYEKLLRLYR